jgi:hypothetical protein
MLTDATISDFQKMLRSAAKNSRTAPHPLTGAAFSTIVKEALRKKRGRKQGG